MKERDLMLPPLPLAKPHIFAGFRDRRLGAGVRACQYDLVLLRRAWSMARVERGWPLGDNPLSMIRMPKNNPQRERRTAWTAHAGSAPVPSLALKMILIDSSWLIETSKGVSKATAQLRKFPKP